MKNLLNRFLIIFLIAILIVAFSNCSKDNNPINNNLSNDIIPLAKGNSWKYYTTLYDTLGNVYNEFNITNQIIGDSTIDNTKWFFFDKNARYFSIFTDGYHTFDKYEIDSLMNQLVYKYPCSNGDKYNQWEVINVDTQLTVSAGTFNCILYSKRLQTLSSFEYLDIFIKPGIGILKSIDYSLTSSNRVFKYKVSDLLEYKF